MPSDARLVSSWEPKAWQTLEPLGAVSPDARFDEVRRVEPDGEDWRSRRLAYLRGSDHPGWEPRADVAARFDLGIRTWAAATGDHPLVIATHGMALTVWLASGAGVDDPAGFWSDLRLPDVLVVNLARWRAGRVLSTWLYQLR